MRSDAEAAKELAQRMAAEAASHAAGGEAAPEAEVAKCNAAAAAAEAKMAATTAQKDAQAAEQAARQAEQQFNNAVQALGTEAQLVLDQYQEASRLYQEARTKSRVAKATKAQCQQRLDQADREEAAAAALEVDMQQREQQLGSEAGRYAEPLKEAAKLREEFVQSAAALAPALGTAPALAAPPAPVAAATALAAALSIRVPHHPRLQCGSHCQWCHVYPGWWCFTCHTCQPSSCWGTPSANNSRPRHATEHQHSAGRCKCSTRPCSCCIRVHRACTHRWAMAQTCLCGACHALISARLAENHEGHGNCIVHQACELLTQRYWIAVALTQPGTSF
jgi:hypothetical protein